MTSKKNWIRLTAVAVLATGVLVSQMPGVAAQTANTPRQRQWGAMRLNRVAKVLNLTEAQKTQAKSIFDSARQAAQPLMPQLKQNREALQAIVKSGNNADLQKLAAEQGNLIAQLITIRTKANEQFYALLTPQQREKADQLHSSMMRGMHRMMPGMHRGPHAGASPQAGGSQ